MNKYQRLIDDLTTDIKVQPIATHRLLYNLCLMTQSEELKDLIPELLFILAVCGGSERHRRGMAVVEKIRSLGEPPVAVTVSNFKVQRYSVDLSFQSNDRYSDVYDKVKRALRGKGTFTLASRGKDYTVVVFFDKNSPSDEEIAEAIAAELNKKED